MPCALHLEVSAPQKNALRFFMMMGAPVPQNAIRTLGRYALHGEIAVGGMATVHFGRLHGSVGFSRTVAIKRLHAQYARDPEFVSMFLDEARLAARIRHPNVVPTLDVVAEDGELFVVMEYVHGESLSRLVKEEVRRGRRIPPRIVCALLSGTLQGLHAAHEARDERGQPLNIVHRDVSPQNILVGSDGVARVLDFGVAKAAGRIHTTRQGQIKGKLPYMAPEQLSGDGAVTRLVDIYAASVCLWETLTGLRLFSGDNEAIVLSKILSAEVLPPSRYVPNIPPALDEVVLYGLSRSPDSRYQTARDMALAIEQVLGGVASTTEIADWMERVAGTVLSARGDMVAAVELQTEAASSPEQVMSEISSMRRAIPELPMLGHPTSQEGFPQLAATAAMPIAGHAGHPTMQGLGPVPSAPPTPSHAFPRTTFSGSLEGGHEEPPSRRSYVVAALLGIVTVLLLVGVVIGFHLVRERAAHDNAAAFDPPELPELGVDERVEPPPSPTGVVLPNGETASAPTGTAPAATPSAPSTNAPLPKGEAKDAAKPSTVTRPAVTTTARPTTVTKPRAGGGATPTSSKPCVPYTVDATGKKHFNRDCI